MKININLALRPLEIGFHEVHISHIEEGSYNGIDFFSCKFENEDGYSRKTFYLNEFGIENIVELFTSIGENNDEVDTKDLLNKSLTIEIERRKFVNRGFLYEENVVVKYLPIDYECDDDGIDYFPYHSYGDGDSYDDGDGCYRVREEFRGLSKEEIEYIITHD
jgi:hypothetical protein